MFEIIGRLVEWIDDLIHYVLPSRYLNGR